jgi:eukaryotic-like serine/threonine-protein kinase
MDGARRYEIVDTIASGDFAVVYRARDRGLGREVAIKQIHQQYLTDERQLARYWQEARLLASLQHPNILTIYDVVRPKGWLIVELMKASLKPATEGEGIDLDFLRTVLTSCLSALQFLHSKGMIHGDIKPSNILVDALGRVKLGDFGLARRASDEAGSLLKGTTKYMAPELLSDQFGTVGPASDLYSLGFSAYELMCGAQFPELFPGLNTFGRDKQIAWMMWHAAPDRAMPQIDRVLEGVPDDLAKVIQRLVIKDQSQRYRSAKEALQDLQASSTAAGLTSTEEPDAAAEARRIEAIKHKRRMRYAALATSLCSLVLCAAMFYWFSLPPPIAAGPPKPVRGVVTKVYVDERYVAIVQSGEAKPKEIKLPQNSRILINDERRLLRDLQPHDQVVVTDVLDAGKKIKELRAFRPETAKGQVKDVKLEDGRFTLIADQGDGKTKDLMIVVPQNLKIAFNGQTELAGQPVKLSDMQPGDRVEAHHLGTESGREATELWIERVVPAEGTIVEVKTDPARNEQSLRINVGTNESPQLIELPCAPDCEVTINDRRLVNNQVLKPSDLKPGDKVSVAHDAHIVKANAHRILHDTCNVTAIEANALSAVAQPAGKLTRYAVGPNCPITLNGAAVTLADLHNGDTIDIAHTAIDGNNPEALSVAAQRPVDPMRRAIVVGNQNYDSRSVTRPEFAVDDANLVHKALVGRYQVAPGQDLLLIDENRARLEQSIPEFLSRIGADGSLVFFFTGRAYKSDEGKVYLALKDIDLARIGETGLPLQWLVDALEKCPAREKLLVLDCNHAGSGADLAMEPTSDEMFNSLAHLPGRGPLRTVTAIASCRAGQRSVDWSEKRQGLFGWLLAQGYAGQADKNRDNRIEPTELFGYLQEQLATLGGQLKVSQTPQLVSPDARPTRLSEEAKVANRKLASFVRPERIKTEDAKPDFIAAAQASGAEPEPQLLWSLLLLKSAQRDIKLRDVAAKFFDEKAAQYPNSLLPLQCIAWLRFEKRTYLPGIEKLAELVAKIPRPKKPSDSYADLDLQMFYWVGQLREFVAVATEDIPRPLADALAALDTAVGRHGPDAQRSYEDGRKKTQAVRDDFQKRIDDADSEAEAKLTQTHRKAMGQYVTFPYDQAVKRILDGLNE